MFVWHRVEACAFVWAGPSWSRWSIAYFPMTPTPGSRERHISYVLGGFLFVVVESIEIGRVPKRPHMQILVSLLPLRQVIQQTLELTNPLARVQVLLVLLRMVVMALLRLLLIRHYAG